MVDLQDRLSAQAIVQSEHGHGHAVDRVALPGYRLARAVVRFRSRSQNHCPRVPRPPNYREALPFASARGLELGRQPSCLILEPDVDALNAAVGPGPTPNLLLERALDRLVGRRRDDE